ncbi:MAG: hypothetical protein WD533_05335 [Dehalococcoidia bacterium]
MKRWPVRLFSTFALLLVLVLAACGGGETDPTTAPSDTPTPEPARDFEEYFSDRTIVIIDGYPPGGGSDTLARMFALHAGKHFPGNPQFEVQNLPGGGGLRGLQTGLLADPNHPQQLTIGMVNTRFVKQVLAGAEIEGFDPYDMQWLGVPDLGRSSRGVVVRRNVATSWDEIEASGRDFTMGSTEPGGPPDTGTNVLEVLGGPIRMVYGYGGTTEVLAGLEREEIDGSGFAAAESTVRRLFPEWIAEQYIVPVVWWSQPFDPDYLAELGAEEPIHIFDAIEMTDEQQRVFETVEELNLLSSRTMFLPPGTPDDVYEAVIQAFEATMNDPEFIAAKQVGNFEAEYITAAEVTEIIAEAEQFSPEGMELFRQLTGIDALD